VLLLLFVVFTILYCFKQSSVEPFYAKYVRSSIDGPIGARLWCSQLGLNHFLFCAAS